VANMLQETAHERDELAAELQAIHSDRQRAAAELQAIDRDREHSATELQLLQAEHARQTVELQQAISDRTRLGNELASIQNAPPRARSARDVADPRTHQTVPLPEMVPANRIGSPPPPPPPASPPPPPPAATRREGTAYSYSEVAEEQVFVPARSPARGGGGGRGSR
ncbi:MAG TPA: hypothetical protein VHZ95_15355, partial [Polyangiales bacterium]|nr:hypothetical protein [Polyangiales bacterium]